LKELWNRLLRIFGQLEIQPSDIESVQVLAIEIAMSISVSLKIFFGPPFKVAIQEQVQFEVNMRSLPVDPFPRMAHDSDNIALGNPISNGHVNRAQMRIEAEVWASSKLVFNYDVPTVVRGGWNIIRVNYIAGGDGVNDIQGFPVCVPVQRANVHPFVKPGIENGCPESSRVPDKSVLPALPGCADYSLEIAFDVLIERGVVAVQQPMVLRGQNDTDRLAERRKSEMKKSRDGRSDHAFEGTPSDAVTHKRFCWHRLGFATQGVIR
jgi:hypothetical protein